MKVRYYRYAGTGVGVLSLALVLFSKSPSKRLYDFCSLLLLVCGFFILWSIRDIVRTVQGHLPVIQELCVSAGFPLPNTNLLNRIFPFVVTAFLLSTSSQLAATILRTRHFSLLHAVADLFGILFFAGVIGIVARFTRLAADLRKLRAANNSGSSIISPPKDAKFVLLMIPKRHREHMIGDLEEEYSSIVLPQYGVRYAQCWYWWHVAESFLPFLWAHVRRVMMAVWLWKHLR